MLAGNRLGICKNQSEIKDKFDSFLNSFLVDLKKPEHLDISYNYIDDDCLYPTVKYLFANHDTFSLKFVNLESTNFSNRAKRTLAVAYKRCPNKKIRTKMGPFPLTQATLQQVT